MNVITSLLINLFALTVLLVGLYLCGRVFIPILAEKDTFFSSPKLGRIKARKRSGRIVGFFDNIVGKGKHVNRETGRIEDGEIKPGGFCWNIFGAYFIGLDEVYKYRIAIGATEDENGQILYDEREASSIFIEGSYPLVAQFVTKDGVRLKVKLQLKLSTVDAATGLSLPISWTIPVFAAVLGTSRDFFGARGIRTLISTPNESGEVNVELKEVSGSDYVRKILGLNMPKIGNVSLAEVCGQKIDAVNLVDIDFADPKMKEAFSAPFVAEQEAQGQIKEAEAYAVAVRIRSEADKQAASNLALAITAKGEAEARVYDRKRKSLGNDPRAAAQVIVAERHSTMGNLTTLINGGNSLVSIPVEKKGD